jgi:hypothetical protein
MNSQVVSGIYASRSEAETVRDHLLEHGLPPAQVDVVQRIRADDNNRPLAEADSVLKDMLIYAAIGAVVGTGIFALAEAALALANLTLFTASPLVAPLAMIGWGFSLGAIIGAIFGYNGAMKKGRLSDVMLHAIRSGHVTVIARARTEEESKLASGIIGPSIVERSEHRAMARA